MFDPYRQWLGIPTSKQPPTYYQLLGISPREDDPDVIENAAERQRDLLNRHREGSQAAVCARLADEIDAARDTLIDPTLRKKYDARLRDAENIAAVEEVESVEPADDFAPIEPLDDEIEEVEAVDDARPVRPVRGAIQDARPARGAVQTRTAGPARAVRAERAQSNGRSPAVKELPPWLWPAVGGGALLLLLLGAGLMFLGRESPKPAPSRVEAPVALAPVPLAPVPTPVPEIKPKAAPPPVEKTEPAPPPPPQPKPAEAPPEPRRAKVKKLPVPDEPSQAKAEKALKETYKVDYEKLKSADDRLVLAAKFLQPNREDRKDPAAWFVLLREARDLSVEAERPRLAVEAIHEIDKWFEIDPVPMTLKALTSIGEPPTGDKPDKSPPLTEAVGKMRAAVALAQVNPALLADNFDAALKFVGLAEAALIRSKADKKHLALLDAKRKEIEGHQKDLQAVVAAREKLKQVPDDPAANRTIGIHLACVMGKWEEGLPLLVKSGDEALKAAARSELARPGDLKAQLALGDYWWNEGRKLGGLAEPTMQEKAVEWYEKVAVRAPDGPEKARAAERVREFSERPLARGIRLPPGSFLGRSVEDRILLLREGGGTMQSEEAVERGLEWLVAHQAPNGGWSLERFSLFAKCNCPDPGGKYEVAGTAFGVLPLLAAGHTPKHGKYSKNVEKALVYIKLNQKPEGNFSDTSYENALATIAMCEAYGMTKEPKLHASAQAAVNFIVRAQSSTGGWGYTPRSTTPDISVTGWHFSALKAGAFAGLAVPKDAFSGLSGFLDRVADPAGTGYGYNSPGNTPARSATGVLCREFLGSTPTEANLLKAIGQLRQPANIGTLEKPAIYFLFYAHQALHHFGGKEWEEWNPKARDLLIAAQDKGVDLGQEHRKGSWSPAGEEWKEQGGRLMFTSLAILSLETYYASVPLNGFGPAVLND